MSKMTTKLVVHFQRVCDASIGTNTVTVFEHVTERWLYRAALGVQLLLNRGRYATCVIKPPLCVRPQNVIRRD